MKLTAPLLALSLAALLLSHSTTADACACCSEQGERSESARAMQPYERGQLDAIVFPSTTRLFTTAAGLDGISGITAAQDTYGLALVRTATTWTFTMTDKNGRSGTLSFAVPTNLETFAVDPQDGPTQGDPVLYKEWRMSSPVTMTGIFTTGAGRSGTQPKIRIVFQGRGNSCTDASQFHAYSMTVSGPSAHYTFYGRI